MKSLFDGALQHLFTWAFKGLGYPQIWEDPDIDMEALAIAPDSHIVAIASGGCNILSYLVADPRRITAVDLSPAHVALNRLKLAAARELPDWSAFYRFFGAADAQENVEAYWRFLAPTLDSSSRHYWERRRILGLGRRRIGMFARDFYRHGLLGRFIGVAHVVARALWHRPARRAQRAQPGRAAHHLRHRARAAVRQAPGALGDQPAAVALRLGIPPAQYTALAGGGDMAPVLRQRLERLVCDFSIADNYSPGRPSAAATTTAAKARCRPICAATIFRRSRARRPGTCAAAIADRLSQGCSSARATVTCFSMRRTGWTTRSSMRSGGDHAHGEARRARDLPHRG